ncbi:MAG: M10 family metallopeptidase C-terminal domain-containing protein [Acuticoccus sp.]
MAKFRSAAPGARIEINALLGGGRWAGQLTFGFAEDVAAGSGAATAGAVPVLPEIRAAVRAAFDAIAGFTGLSVTQAPRGERADLAVVSADTLALPGGGAVPLGGYAFAPGPDALAGDIFLGPALVPDLAPGRYGHRAVLHEVGHALGLKHPHETGPFGALPASRDGPELTVMSARSAPGLPAGVGLGTEADGFAETFMPADIAALQHLYGANFGDARDTRHVFDPDERVILRTIWDGGGTDTYDFSAYRDDLAIDLAPGAHTRTGQEPQLNRAEELSTGAAPLYADGAVHNAFLHRGDLRSLIENATGGAGDDTITGNIADNRLWGGAGMDHLSSGRGTDRLFGGTGADRLAGGGGGDRLVGGLGGDRLLGGEGADRLRGGPGDDVASGGTGADTIALAAGDDTGEGERGNDTLAGRAGDDRLAGGSGNDSLSGGRGDDTLSGGAGADTLVGGAAGPGGDRLTGGSGADLFVITHDARIADLDIAAGDRIDVPAPRYAAQHIERDGADLAVTLAYGGATLVLAGIDHGALDPDIFI